MLERGTDRPPYVARILHHAGAHQGRHIGVELLLGAEQLRHAGARQLVVGGEPVAFEPGRPRIPERRGCCQGHEQRKIGQHAGHHVDALVRIGQLDMHVHAAQHVALADHLQVMHDGVVALGTALLHVVPGRGRMGAGGEDRQPMLGGGLGERLAQETQLLARGRHVGMRQRRDLDLRLQQFPAGLPAGRLLGGFQECLRHGAGRRLGIGVDQEEFLFDAELENIRHAFSLHSGAPVVRPWDTKPPSALENSALKSLRMLLEGMGMPAHENAHLPGLVACPRRPRERPSGNARGRILLDPRPSRGARCAWRCARRTTPG